MVIKRIRLGCSSWRRPKQRQVPPQHGRERKEKGVRRQEVLEQKMRQDDPPKEQKVEVKRGEKTLRMTQKTGCRSDTGL
jgi:hypothetical protein